MTLQVLILYEWEEGGYYQLETGWTLGSRMSRKNRLQGEHSSVGEGAERSRIGNEESD